MATNEVCDPKSRTRIVCMLSAINSSPGSFDCDSSACYNHPMVHPPAVSHQPLVWHSLSLLVVLFYSNISRMDRQTGWRLLIECVAGSRHRQATPRLVCFCRKY